MSKAFLDRLWVWFFTFWYKTGLFPGLRLWLLYRSPWGLSPILERGKTNKFSSKV